MKTNIAAPIGGVILLAAGIALASYTASSTDALKAANTKIINKYLNKSADALKSGKVSEAEKWAKKAIAVDPQNKNALNSYKQAVLAACTKTETPATQATSSQTNTATSTPKQAPANTPKKPEAEPDDEMGCI